MAVPSNASVRCRRAPARLSHVPGILLLVVVIAAIGCSSATRGVRIATHSALRVTDAAPDPLLIEQHCPFGQPTKLPTLEHGPTTVVTRAAYALEHDSLSKIALWVCSSLDPDLVFGDAERKNNWLPDPDVTGPRAIDADYTGSGFHRGHMTASEDRVATQALNDQTFFLSNAVPQNGSLNSGQWQQLEIAVRSWISSGILTEAKMITGGFFYDPDEDDPSTADGLVEFQQVGNGAVAVPTHVFKIVVGRRGTDLMAIAFVAENKKPVSGWSWTKAITTIDWLEERAGLNFMPDLDPTHEAALEGVAGEIPTP
jgi:endonuclease G